MHGIPHISLINGRKRLPQMYAKDQSQDLVKSSKGMNKTLKLDIAKAPGSDFSPFGTSQSSVA